MDFIKGGLVGVALGDALGAPHEFRYHTVKYTGILEHKTKFKTRWQGVRYAAIGQYTDDTEMTLALLRSLIRNNGYNEDDVILSYERWASTASMMGINTRKLFKGVKTVRGFRNRQVKVFSDTISQSNGSLMRAFPLALLNDDSAVVTDCELTNPNPVNVWSSLIYIDLVRLSINSNKAGLSRQEIREQAIEYIQAAQEEIPSELEQLYLVIDEALDGRDRDVTGKTKGWVLHGLYCALYSLLYFDGWKASIDWVIGLGGDTDTNAAIAGGLMGSFLGFTSMIGVETDYERTEEQHVTSNNVSVLLDIDWSDSDIEPPTEFKLDDLEFLVEELFDLWVSN